MGGGGAAGFLCANAGGDGAHAIKLWSPRLLELRRGMRRQRHAPEASGGWVSTDEEEGNTSSKHVDCFVQFQSAAAAAKIVQGWGGWSMTSDGHNMMTVKYSHRQELMVQNNDR